MSDELLRAARVLHGAYASAIREGNREEVNRLRDVDHALLWVFPNVVEDDDERPSPRH